MGNWSKAGSLEKTEERREKESGKKTEQKKKVNASSTKRKP